MAKEKADFDTPWKNILDLYFQDFIAYCWPDKFKEIDWSKGFKMLDKELSKIARNAPIGNRIVDKLVEIHRQDGKEAHVLIHIEVQGNQDQTLEERMFIYRYRLRDLHRKPISSLAVLIDNNARWRPGTYREELWGSYIEMGFPCIKLLDYQSRIVELENSGNPFAHVILAQLAARGNKDHNMLATKTRLTKRLYNNKWKKDDIINLYSFIDWVIALPPELELEYHQSIEQFEKEELKVAYITTAERIGIQRGECAMLLSLLTRKFKTIPDEYCAKIRKTDAETLLTWGERVLEKETLEEIFED